MIRTTAAKHPGSIKKDSVHAVDGELGPVNDVLFDDYAWSVRYLILKLKDGLTSHGRAISPMSVSGVDRQMLNTLYIDLSKEKAERAPYLEANLPVAAQQEVTYHAYLDVDPYWTGAAPAMMPPVTPAAGAAPLPYSVPEAELEEPASDDFGYDPHLRSARELIGYRIETEEDTAGHVEDLLLDDETWQVRYIVVDTRNWLPAKLVLVPLDFISEMRWSNQLLRVDLTSERIKDAPAWYPAVPLDQDYESSLREHYGLAPYQVEG